MEIQRVLKLYFDKEEYSPNIYGANSELWSILSNFMPLVINTAPLRMTVGLILTS